MSDPTFADVASKTVDHIAGGVKALADAAQKVAPHAWEVAVKQQKIEGWTDIAMGVGVLAAVCAVAIVVPRIIRLINKDDEEVESHVAFARLIVLVAALFVCGMAVNTCLVEGAKRVANPEYYAATALLEAVK